jgi:multidrug efflux pump subunit AcrA (membrane-fusion protein)
VGKVVMKYRSGAVFAAVLLAVVIVGLTALAERVGDLPKELGAASVSSAPDVPGQSSHSSPASLNPAPSASQPAASRTAATAVSQRVGEAVSESSSDSTPLDPASAVAVQDCAVRFAEELNVPSTEAGVIAELNVTVGQAVALGDDLARLDDRSLKIRSRAAALRLAAAQQQVADDLELRYAEAAQAEALAELETNRSIYKEASGAVPLSNLRRLRLAVERAELEVARAKKNTKQAEIEVDMRSADMAVIDDTLRRLRLQSPLSGVVLQIFKQRGEWVASGETVVRLARLDRLHVHALLAADQLAPQDCIDQPVSVSWIDPISSQKHHLRGRVASVQPQRLAGGRYRIQAEIVNQRSASGRDWMLHPGTEVDMAVYPAQRRVITKSASHGRPTISR